MNVVKSMSADPVFHHMNVMANYAIGQVRACPNDIDPARIKGLIKLMASPHKGHILTICACCDPDPLQCNETETAGEEDVPLICTPQSDLGKLICAAYCNDVPKHIDQVPARYLSGDETARDLWRREVVEPFVEEMGLHPDTTIL